MDYTIKTSKGDFLIYNDTYNNFGSNLVNYKKGIKLSSITEEESSEIVEQESIGFGSEILKSYKDTLFNLLESHGIEITENTYIFKI